MLFDRPDVVANALLSLPEGTEIVGGDFFAEAPAAADVYVMSKVTHDWGRGGDAHPRHCPQRDADSTLLLVEIVLPEHAVECAAAVRVDLEHACDGHRLEAVPA